jgi:glycosyltransferase involved in cell wall biosynthesis
VKPPGSPPARVTVGITCYNASDTIGRAIASAAKQDWPDLEILVVDDASDDNSAEVARAVLADIDRGRLIVRPANGGVASARNTLLAEATGRYIVFFDDDDESIPERVTVQCLRLEAETQDDLPVLCFASGARRYPNGYLVDVDAIGSSGRAPVGEEVLAYLLLNERSPNLFYGAGVPSCALMAPVEALRAVGGYDEKLGRVEDVDLALRMALAGARFVGCPERLYLQHATSGSDKTPARNLAAELKVVEKYREWLTQRSLYNYARDWFCFREAWFAGRRLEAALRAGLLFAADPRLTIRRLSQSAPTRLAHERSIRRAP